MATTVCVRVTEHDSTLSTLRGHYKCYHGAREEFLFTFFCSCWNSFRYLSLENLKLVTVIRNFQDHYRSEPT